MSLGKHLISALVGLVLAAALAAGFAYYRSSQQAGAPVAPESATTQADVGGPFTLTDHHGTAVSEKDFAGKYLMIFFGYSFCPDICPTTLSKVGNSLDLLGEKAEKVQALFITVDPQRDSAEVLRDYVSNFHPGIIGLTGTPEQIDRVAKAYKVYHAKAETGAEADEDYLVDHTAFVYLMDPQGNLAEVFFHDASAESMAKAVAARL
jgi:protein SCO1/2